LIIIVLWFYIASIMDKFLFSDKNIGNLLDVVQQNTGVDSSDPRTIAKTRNFVTHKMKEVYSAMQRTNPVDMRNQGFSRIINNKCAAVCIDFINKQKNDLGIPRQPTKSNPQRPPSNPNVPDRQPSSRNERERFDNDNEYRPHVDEFGYGAPLSTQGGFIGADGSASDHMFMGTIDESALNKGGNERNGGNPRTGNGRGQTSIDERLQELIDSRKRGGIQRKPEEINFSLEQGKVSGNVGARQQEQVANEQKQWMMQMGMDPNTMNMQSNNPLDNQFTGISNGQFGGGNEYQAMFQQPNDSMYQQQMQPSSNMGGMYQQQQQQQQQQPQQYQQLMQQPNMNIVMNPNMVMNPNLMMTPNMGMQQSTNPWLQGMQQQQNDQDGKSRGKIIKSAEFDNRLNEMLAEREIDNVITNQPADATINLKPLNPMNMGMPQQMMQGIPQQMNMGMPQQMMQGIPQQMMQGIPQQMMQGIPQQMMQRTPQTMNQMLPVMLPNGQQVMAQVSLSAPNGAPVYGGQIVLPNGHVMMNGGTIALSSGQTMIEAIEIPSKKKNVKKSTKKKIDDSSSSSEEYEKTKSKKKSKKKTIDKKLQLLKQYKQELSEQMKQAEKIQETKNSEKAKLVEIMLERDIKQKNIKLNFIKNNKSKPDKKITWDKSVKNLATSTEFKKIPPTENSSEFIPKKKPQVTPPTKIKSNKNFVSKHVTNNQVTDDENTINQDDDYIIRNDDESDVNVSNIDLNKESSENVDTIDDVDSNNSRKQYSASDEDELDSCAQGIRINTVPKTKLIKKNNIKSKSNKNVSESNKNVSESETVKDDQEDSDENELDSCAQGIRINTVPKISLIKKNNIKSKPKRNVSESPKIKDDQDDSDEENIFDVQSDGSIVNDDSKKYNKNTINIKSDERMEEEDYSDYYIELEKGKKFNNLKLISYDVPMPLILFDKDVPFNYIENNIQKTIVIKKGVQNIETLTQFLEAELNTNKSKKEYHVAYNNKSGKFTFKRLDGLSFSILCKKNSLTDYIGYISKNNPSTGSILVSDVASVFSKNIELYVNDELFASINLNGLPEKYHKEIDIEEGIVIKFKRNNQIVDFGGKPHSLTFEYWNSNKEFSKSKSC
jgi:hypothetical protein